MTNGKLLPLQIPDPSLILLIGPSGAGKSTFAARHFTPTEVVSSDRCRAMLSDDESDQTINDAAFALLHQIARIRLSVGKLTVIDATNLQFRARRPLLRMARQHRLPAIAIVFTTTVNTCLEYNRARPDRFVSEDVIEQHARELAGALGRIEREGYARIYLLNETTVNDVVIERIGDGIVSR
ncbi:MAG: AAA family ATPase [Blastocatellia bacterium]